jgi:hypothetical protein
MGLFLLCYDFFAVLCFCCHRVASSCLTGFLYNRFNVKCTTQKLDYETHPSARMASLFFLFYNSLPLSATLSMRNYSVH